MGDQNGIDAANNGSGALSISVADVAGGTGDGIRASNGSYNLVAGTDLTITATGSVIGGSTGINATNYGSGALSITAGDVTGSFDGINANNFGVDLSITSTGLIEAAFGVIAVNSGYGALNLTVADVTAANSSAIYAENGVNTTDLTITATGAVRGGGYGVSAVNRGEGALSITTNAVSATTSAGIAGSNYNGTDLTITATGPVTGGSDGILADNYGSGALSITVVDVTGGTYDATDPYISTADMGNGIDAFNSAAGTDLTITATGAVTGADDGIYADNNGSGALSISVADVAGGSGNGINADNSRDGADLTITATGAVTGGLSGIAARLFGAGDLSINAASVTGSSYGILAFNTSNGANLDITATGPVTGGTFGINATLNGAGALSITVAEVTGTSADGVNAENGLNGTDLTIVATGAVTGGEDGIFASNNGSGALSISVAEVAGVAGDGIRAESSRYGADLTITATGAVTGGDFGINAFLFGAGDLSISAASVTGATADGIFAFNTLNGANLAIIATGPVTGSYEGIDANLNGSGALSITVAEVAGTSGDGVNAENGSNGTDLTITATGAVTGGDDGIVADNYGSGALSITVVDVTGGTYVPTTDPYYSTAGTGNGIDAYNSAAGTDLSITATGAVTGSQSGISAENYGSGALSISVVDVAGDTDDGIYAFNSANGTDLTITTTGAVTGGSVGVNAVNEGAGGLGISIGGAVSGGHTGVSALSATTTAVTLLAGASASGATSAILFGPASADTLSLGAGASLLGEVRLNAGDDVLNESGASFTAIFGGAGRDTVNFSAPGRALGDLNGAGDALQEFEIVNLLSGGFELDGAITGLEAFTVLAGESTLSGRIEAGLTTIAAGGGLVLVDGAEIGGDLLNQGGLRLAGVAGVTGDFTQEAGGLFSLDLASEARLEVAGAASLGGDLEVILPGNPASALGQSVVFLTGAAVSGGFANFSGLQGGLIEFEVAIDATSAALTAQVTDAFSTFGVDGNAPVVAAAIEGGDIFAFSPEVFDYLGDFADNPSFINAGLNAIAPSGLLGGLQQNEQLGLLLGDQFLARRQALAGAAGEERAGLWLSVDGAIGGLTAAFGAEQNLSAWLISIGGDVRVAPNLRLGGAFSYGAAGNDLSSGGRVETEGLLVSGYGAYQRGGLFLDAHAGFGDADFTSLRQVESPSGLDSFTGETDGRRIFVGARGGYLFEPAPKLRAGPVLDYHFADLRLDGFSESGGAGALAVGAQDGATQRLGVGGLARYQLDALGGARPFLELRSVFELARDRSLAAGLVGGPGFVVNGVDLDDQFWAVATGVETTLGKALSLDFRYEADLGRSDLDAHRFSGTLRWRF